MKFSTHDCPACQSMSAYDSDIANELGISFVDIDMKDIDSYRQYRKYLLRNRSSRREIALPTYLLVDIQQEGFTVDGEIMGSMPLQSFRGCILEMMTQSSPAETKATE